MKIKLFLAGDQYKCDAFLAELQGYTGFKRQRFLDSGTFAFNTDHHQVEIVQLQNNDDSFKGIIFACADAEKKKLLVDKCNEIASIEDFSTIDHSETSGRGAASSVRILINRVIRQPSKLYPRRFPQPITGRVTLDENNEKSDSLDSTGSSYSLDSSYDFDSSSYEGSISENQSSETRSIDASKLACGEELPGAVALKSLFAFRESQLNKNPDHKKDNVLPSELGLSRK